MENASGYDAVVVGAGTAGLSAALVLGRSRRRVLVLDGGEPRNAPSSGVHYFLTRDGTPPDELLRIGREQLEPYSSVEVRRARATKAAGSDGDFLVTLEDGITVGARKILLATGVHDELPERPGFRELWGRGIFHCPYCHGWEVRDRPLAVLNSGEDAGEQAAMIHNWSRDLILLTDGPATLDDEAREKLGVLGIPINETPISRVEGGGLGCSPPSRLRGRLRGRTRRPLLQAAPAPALRPRRRAGMRVRGNGAVTHGDQERSDDEGDHRARRARGGRRQHDAPRSHNGRRLRGHRSGVYQPRSGHAGGVGFRPPSRPSRCGSRASRRGNRHWLRVQDHGHHEVSNLPGDRTRGFAVARPRPVGDDAFYPPAT